MNHRTMYRSILGVLVALFVAAEASPLRAQGYTPSPLADFEFEPHPDDPDPEWPTSFVIASYTGNDETVSIPFERDGIEVLSVKEGAFDGCDTVRNIVVPLSVELGIGALSGCPNLQSIEVFESIYYSSSDGVLFSGDGRTIVVCPAGRVGTYAIPDGVTRIGSLAFAGCSDLTGITIPDSVTRIGFSAFKDCTQLASITLPDAVTSISGGLFSGCVNLSEINISTDVNNIGTYAFSGLTSLASFSIPDAITVIPEGIFSGCVALAEVSLPSATTEIGIGVFYGCVALTNVVLPANLTAIRVGAFSGCTALSGISLPDGVSVIEEQAFRETGLTSIYLPESVTVVGRQAFSGSTGMQAINVAPSNPTFSSAGGVLFDKSGTTLITYPPGLSGAYATPDGLTAIADFAFSECIGLTGIVVADSVEEIGVAAFRECSSLETVVLPDGLSVIKAQTFALCTALTNVSLPKSLRSIGDYAYMGCSSLVEILFPDGLTNIGEGAFTDCTALTEVTIPSSVVFLGTVAFSPYLGGTPNFLRSVTFEGDAPSLGIIPFGIENSGLTVYHYEGAAGFDSPDWTSFALVVLPPPGSDDFHSWEVLDKLPKDRRQPSDRNGPLDLPNLVAYAIGVNPLQATPVDLPMLSRLAPSGDSAFFQYRRATNAGRVALTVQTSTTLDDWVAASVISTRVIDEGIGWERLEIEVEAPADGVLILRLRAAETPPTE